MLSMEGEEPADQIRSRTQWWRSGQTKFLVTLSRDDARCAIFVSGDKAERLYEVLNLSSEPSVGLEPGIDCYAITCASARLSSVLEKLAKAVP